MHIGIDDMALYVPKLFLDNRTLAAKHHIPYEKLAKGLGQLKLAICDAHEDAATMAAEALFELLDKNNLDPNKIGRVYLGTESALDDAKPTATYAVEMVEQKMSRKWGDRCFGHCDVVDLTFACIGAVDALHNCMDWVRANPDSMAVVIASDIAKYELNSSGEYTQGAGAVAMLIKAKPRLLSFNNIFGVSMTSVHDFFKPRRERFTETPVFDGQYSNTCYENRMADALHHFHTQAIQKGLMKEGEYPGISGRWARMIFHLPYAFHAKRIYVNQFIKERIAKGLWESDLVENQFPSLDGIERLDPKEAQIEHEGLLKAVSKSALYQAFAEEKFGKAQRAGMETGNLYTASIFLALMSALEADWKDQTELAGKRLGFVAYGSGAKSKVFEGELQAGWEQVAANFNIAEKLEKREEISYETYERLHTGCQKESVKARKGHWALDKIGTEGNYLGARYYKVIA